MTDIYAITDEERRQYTAFSENVWKQIVRKPPETLWYYTSGSTFARILKSREIWSTQISCLNDHSEFRYSVRLLRDEMKSYLRDGDEHIRFLAQHLYETLEQDGADASWFFVFCTSEVRDDLSQWRAYGGGEGGVSIGFDPMRLMKQEMASRGYVLPVQYHPVDHRAIVGDVATWTLRFFRDGLVNRKGAERKIWADKFLEAWRDHVVYFAPVLKDISFEKEKEWRLIMALAPADIPRIEIQERRALISRHLPIQFVERLPIREVVVGPCRHPSVSRISVGTYLQARGYALNDGEEKDANKVTVSSSRIPFQTM